MMRVAFFVNRFPIVSEAFIANAATGLADAGVSVHIYALHGSDAPRTAATVPASQFELREKPRQRLFRAPLAAMKLLASHGLRASAAFDAEYFGADGPSLVALHEAAMFRDAGRYDILHCQFGTLAERVLNHRRAGLLSGRVLVHFRGYDISSHIEQYGPRVYDAVFKEADGFITNCRFFRDRLLALGAPPERTIIVPSPVNTELFRPRPRTIAAGERLRIVCVGRLVEKKGLTYALAALERAIAGGVDLECVILGDGPLRGALEAQAVALGIADRVRFAGAAPQQMVAAEIDGAHMFLAASVTASNGDQDAAINTLKEAMAAGCPFVATAHGGIPELVEGVDAGILAPEADAEGLHQALVHLLARREEWPEMGRRGRAHIEQNYSIETATRLTMAVYRRALDRNTAAPADARELQHA